MIAMMCFNRFPHDPHGDCEGKTFPGSVPAPSASPFVVRDFLSITLEGPDSDVQRENLRQAIREISETIQANIAHNEIPNQIFVTIYGEESGEIRADDLGYDVPAVLFSITTVDESRSITDDFGVLAGSDTIEALS